MIGEELITLKIQLQKSLEKMLQSWDGFMKSVT